MFPFCNVVGCRCIVGIAGVFSWTINRVVFLLWNGKWLFVFSLKLNYSAKLPWALINGNKFSQIEMPVLFPINVLWNTFCHLLWTIFELHAFAYSDSCFPMANNLQLSSTRSCANTWWLELVGDGTRWKDISTNMTRARCQVSARQLKNWNRMIVRWLLKNRIL